ncbi:MAG: hypothetical protein WCD44_02665 [Candidatus Babeliales bacterium]
MFKKIAIFVNENSGGNKKLWKAFSTCQKVSETIRTIIKHARAVSAAPAPNLYPLERAESKNYQITITKNIQRLEEISKPNLEEQKNILENTTFYLSAAKKNSVKNLLLNLISVLEFTIDKVVNDYNRLWAESL